MNGNSKRKHRQEKIMKAVMAGAVALVLVTVASIILTIVIKGLPGLSWEMVSSAPGKDWNTANDGGFLNAITGSLWIVIPSAILGAAVSVPAVFYMTMYHRRSSTFSYIGRLCYDILYGIPSIVYGAFAFMVMVAVGMRASVLGGIIVTTMLIIPIMVRSGDEIARNVPDDLVDAAYSLGATKWETLKIVLRFVLPGMMTAFLLAVGKAVGDAAAVMFTAGFSDNIARDLSSPTATLPLAIFNWVAMPAPFPQRAYTAALVLTIIVLALSLGGRWFSARFKKRNL